MPELPAPRKYLYWSKRRVESILRDNGIDLERATTRKFKTPAGPFLPQAEIESRSRTPSRDKVASALERYLGGVTVQDFVTPPEVKFARGRGSIVFSELLDWSEDISSVGMFTDTTSSTGRRVAVCMFGSLENLADVIAAVNPPRTGWTSSAAPAVMRYLASRCTAVGRHWDDERDLVEEAVNLLMNQGVSGADPAAEARNHGRRGFTYGHLDDDGEWMLEVYRDLEFRTRSTAHGGYDRVVLGAPLWVRTPDATSLTLYDAEYRQGSVHTGSPERQARFRFGRKWPA